MKKNVKGEGKKEKQRGREVYKQSRAEQSRGVITARAISSIYGPLRVHTGHTHPSPLTKTTPSLPQHPYYPSINQSTS